MLCSVRSYRQDAFHHGGFGVAWNLASHMTGSSGGQPDWYRMGRLSRWQMCAPDAEWGLGDWALWFQDWECNAERWLLLAGSWDCDWRCSNHCWDSFHVLVHVPWQNTVVRLGIDESVWPNETFSGSSENWIQHLTPMKNLSCCWSNSSRGSDVAASWMASKFQHLFPRLPFAPSRVLFSGHRLWPLPICWLIGEREHLWRCENDARHLPSSSILHHREMYIQHTYRIPTMPLCTQLRDSIWDVECGFCLVQSGLRLHAGTG